jgi:pyrroline-5-carboxylate reductase
MKLVFIGGGNMAAAMIGGLLKQGWHAADIAVVDIAQAALERLSQATGVRTFTDPRAGIADSDCIVFAVKPQQLRAVSR